jgi:hypothetical protein
MLPRFHAPFAMRRLVAAAACALALGPANAADKVTHEIKAPHYGDTLFYFFQDQYFTSITNLMVSQKFERVGEHADEAEVLRGGMLLSYGLHREAGEIFAQLIEKGASPAVQDRAWFYLAKIRYQRGFLAEATDAIGRVGKNLPPALEEERVLLHANLLMAREDYAGAAAVLKGLTASTSAGLYARYNLGVALVRSGDTEGGSKLLDELGKTTPIDGEELRSLRDKANVALGFAALADKHPEVAQTALERVRLQSAQSNKALLGFGWASATLKDPRKALVPWTELASREISDSAVLEARIAVPYAYAELGALGQALDRYNDAIATFDSENVKLDESIVAIRSGKFLDSLLERNPGEEMGWFWTIRELPELPHAGHLSQVLAGHEFQEAFKNFRDLRFLSRNLQNWQDSLSVFNDMLDNRRKAYAERLPKVRDRDRSVEIAALQKRRDAVAAELAQAETEADGVAFADDRQRELRERIKQVQAQLKALGDDPEFALGRQLEAALKALPEQPEFALARAKARLASGALTWQLAQEYPGRLWDAQKNMRTIDAGLDEARGHDTALAQAQRDEPVRFERFAARIVELDKAIKALMPRVAALSGEQQKQVQELAVAQLQGQKERLAIYSTQARFAVAQLYDRAIVGSKRDENAPKQ